MATFTNGNDTLTSTSNVEIIAAPGANNSLHITTIIVDGIDCASATSVLIKDGTTTIARVPCPANGGATITLPAPLVCTANTALNAALADSVASGNLVYVTAVGYYE